MGSINPLVLNMVTDITNPKAVLAIVTLLSVHGLIVTVKVFDKEIVA